MVMSLDAFMLSRFTTLTPLNGGMLVETKLILSYVKQNTLKASSTSCIPAFLFIARPKSLEKWPICISFSKLCERMIVPPSFRVPSFCIYLDGQEGKYFMKAETTKIGEIAKKE